MQIHIRTPEITDDVLANFFSCSLGSRWFRFHGTTTDLRSFQVVATTPSVWVGEVSWLKGLVFKDKEEFVPDPVQGIRELFSTDGDDVITEELIARANKVMGMENKTQYTIENGDEVVQFLRQHVGSKAFVVSW